MHLLINVDCFPVIADASIVPCVEAMCFSTAYVVNQITVRLEEMDNKAIANSLCYFQFAGENERFRGLSSACLFLLPFTTCQCTVSSTVELSG
jgi:hypothetical protein